MQKKIFKPIEIKISTVVAISAILHDADIAVLDGAMKDMTNGMSDFFDNEFAVLDVAAIGTQQVDWPALVALFKSYQLNVVAVRNATPAMHASIQACALAIEPNAKPREAEAPVFAVPAPAPAPAPAPVQVQVPAPGTTPATAAPVAAPVQAAARAMIIDTPVRAGQRIYARGADLIITAVVNNGAEVIADGSIHVYAPLRGRALAGASGNAEARIFALSMEPELVSVAGVYRTFDDGFPSGLEHQPVMVRLSDDRLDILSLTEVPRA